MTYNMIQDMMTGLNNITGKEFPAWEQSVSSVETSRSQRGNGVYSAVDAREIQGRSTLVRAWLRCVVMLVLMMTVGVNGVMAQNYKYIFINNKGKQAFNFSTNNTTTGKTTLAIHPRAKSVLATNFRFYTTEAAAVADAAGTIGTAGTDYYTEGTTISSITGITNYTFYVRYDLADDPAIDITGEKTYKLQIHGRNKALYYIYYDSSDDNKLKINDTYDGSEDGKLKFLWRFESGDPYDVYITNLLGYNNFSDYVVSTTGAGTGNDNKGKLANYQQKIADGNYNQSAAPMSCLQSFIIMQKYYGAGAWWNNGMYQIMGAYNGIDNRPKDVKPAAADENNMPYYLCRNANPPKNYDQLDFARSWRNEDADETSNPSQIQFIVVTQKYTFHIINNSGEEAMSAKTASVLNADDPITEEMIPDILKSPAATNYTFYPTAADAVAGTNRITTLPQDDDVYVRYETHSSDIYLNGEIKYNLSVGGDHYLYATDATTISSAAASDAADTYKWTLHGGDPYQITIKNGDNSQFVTYDVSVGEAVPTLSGTGSKFFLHQSTSGKYELVVLDNNYPTSYYTLGYDDTNGLKLYSNTNYPFGHDEIQTVFTAGNIAIIDPLPTANNRTYDGTTQNLVTEGVCEHGTVWYREGTEGDYTTTIPTKRDAGTYHVYYKSVGNTGYDDLIVTDPIIVTIAPAPVTVTAENKTKVYGESDPTLTATVTGLVSGESESLITYTISRAAGNEVGSYTITPAGNALQGNYTVSFVTGNLTVNKKTVGITWGETSFLYNGTPQAPTATATGLVYNDKIGITVTGEKTNVGTYTATASALTGDKKNNYQLPSNKTTTFSIVKAPINTTIVMTEWSYGDYDASTNSPSVSFNPENLEVTYLYKVKDADDETYVAAVPTDVGIYTIQASIPGTDNRDAQVLTKNFSITQKALNKNAVGSPANGITITVTKDTSTDPATYPVTVTHNYLGTPKTLIPYVDDEHDYDYKVSGSQSVSGYVVTVTAKKEGDLYTGNYTGFAKAAYAEPTFYLDGATWSPSENEYAAVYLGLFDGVPDLVASGSEIKAYIVNKVNPTIGTVTVSPVEYVSDATATPPTKTNYIPEGVPVLLLSNKENLSGFTTSSPTEATSDITAAVTYSNYLMIAPDEPSDPKNPDSPHGVAVKDTEAYIFYNGEFVLTKEGIIKPDYFFLYNPNYKATPEQSGGSNPAPRRTLKIVLEERVETGMAELRNDELTESRTGIGWYTIDGRRLNGKPEQRGLYIVDGKKVMVK